MRLALTLSVILLLGACSPSETTPPKLLEEQRNLLDKAKAVDTAQQQQNEAQQKSIEEQTQ